MSSWWLSRSGIRPFGVPATSQDRIHRDESAGIWHGRVPDSKITGDYKYYAEPLSFIIDVETGIILKRRRPHLGPISKWLVVQMVRRGVKVAVRGAFECRFARVLLQRERALL